MKKLALHKLLDFINKKEIIDKEEIKNKIIELSYVEGDEIIGAFLEGVEYGNSEFQTFDYPETRYYSSTYEKIKKENESKNI